jgi:hypothetical protein
MADLKNPKLMYLKGFLFLVILLWASAMLIARDPSGQTVLLVVLVAWASARLYYFMFYVIEKYIDREYKFAGIGSFLAYLIRERANRGRTDEPGQD